MKTYETFYPAAEAKLEALGLGPFSQKAWKLLHDAMTAANAKKAARSGTAPRPVVNVPIVWLLIWLALRMALALALFEAAHPSKALKALGGADGLRLGLNTDQRSWGIQTKARAEALALVPKLNSFLGSPKIDDELHLVYFRSPWEMRQEIGEFRKQMAEGSGVEWPQGSALGLCKPSDQLGLPMISSFSSFLSIASLSTISEVVSEAAQAGKPISNTIAARRLAGHALGLHPWLYENWPIEKVFSSNFDPCAKTPQPVRARGPTPTKTVRS